MLFVIPENYVVAINTKTSYAAFVSLLLPSSVWVMKLLSEIANFFTELWLLPTEIQRSLEIRDTEGSMYTSMYCTSGFSALLLLGNTTFFAIPENYALAINTKTSFAAFRCPVPISSAWLTKLLSEAANFSFAEL